MKRSLFLMILLSLLPSRGSGQIPGIGVWRTFTSMTTVRSVAVSPSGTILAATGGGVYQYDPVTKGFTHWTNADGLPSNDLTAISVTQSGSVWVGAADGSLATLEPPSQTWKSIPDIAQSNRLLKGIQRLVPNGDTMFVVVQFGVVVYRTDRKEFGDAYANFGFALQPIVNDVAVSGDSVWVATDQGLAAASLKALNLASPTSWKRFGTAEGLNTASIRSLGVLRDSLLIGTERGLMVRLSGAFQTHPVLSTGLVVRIKSAAQRLYVQTSESGSTRIQALSFLFDNGQSVAAPYNGTAADFAVHSLANETWLATSTQGIVVERGGSWLSRLPNGPKSNLFISLSVDAGGVLWAGTGFNGGGQGFMRYDADRPDTSRWRTWSTATSSVLFSNDTYKVSPTSDGNVWVSSWGDGVVQVRSDSIVRRIDTRSVPPLASSVSGSSTFSVIGGVASDESGKPWFVNRTAVTGSVLARLDNDTTFTYFKNLTGSGEGRFTSLVFDRNGTMFLANSEPTAKSSIGLYYFNPGRTLPGTSGTGGWGIVTQTEGLANNTVISLCVDLEGEVWAGTDLGVTIFNEPSDPRTRRSSSFALREQSIQAIAVDPLNNKWVGTKEGVFVVSPDGSQLVGQYTVANTTGKLVDNDVRAVAIDQLRGLVYMGTERGLSMMSVAAVQTQRQFGKLRIGPNPFVIPSEDYLTIANLVASASIKILRADGVVVSQFDAQGGGRAFWDGKDQQGRWIASGVYVVVAATRNGEQVAAGKVAVIRR